MERIEFFLGVDLGQSQDYTAVAILERVGVKPSGEVATPEERYEIRGLEARYDLRHLERPQLGTPYPVIVDRVKELVTAKPLEGNTTLVVDSTGVGAPVVDLLRKAGLHPTAITITGGYTVSKEWPNFSVPKRDLVSTLSVLFDSKRLKIAEELPLAKTLLQELLNFKVKITAAANDTYEAWRDGDHDDMVLAVALACWYGEQERRFASGPPPEKTFRRVI